MAEEIKIHADIYAPVEKVWKMYTEPVHITKWNNASDDWHTPWAKNDLRAGGTFTFRMEAKDGGAGFDFKGTYTNVVLHQTIEYVMEDGRKAHIAFHSRGRSTNLKVTFDPEDENPIEMQRAGWQAILNNFKRYVESS